MLAAHPHLTTVQLDDFLDDGHPQAGAGDLARGVCPEKAVEDLLLKRLGNAFTMVDNRNLEVIAVPGNNYGDG